jgi:hypothetical protein
LVALPSVLVAVLGALYGQWQLEPSRRAWQIAQQQLNHAHRALASLRAERHSLPAQAAIYRTLQQQRVITDEAPDVRAIVASLRRHAHDLHATFGDPHAYREAEAGAVRLRLHPLSLRFEVLHEGRMLDLLDELRASGWFLLERCSVERTESFLHAECIGGWLTVQPHADAA